MLIYAQYFTFKYAIAKSMSHVGLVCDLQQSPNILKYNCVIAGRNVNLVKDWRS